MSAATARAEFVRMCEAAAPTIVRRGLPSKFKHAPKAAEGVPAHARSFTVRIASLATVADDSVGARRRVGDFDVAVFYPNDIGDPDSLDEAMASDYEALADYLMDPANWTSGVIHTLGFGADEIIPADLESTDTGRTMTLRVPAEFT